MKKSHKDKPGVSAITERNNVIGVDVNLCRTEHCCTIDGKRSNVMFFLVTRGCPKRQLRPPMVTAVEAWLQSGHVKVRMGKTHVRTADALSEFSIEDPDIQNSERGRRAKKPRKTPPSENSDEHQSASVPLEELDSLRQPVMFDYWESTRARNIFAPAPVFPSDVDVKSVVRDRIDVLSAVVNYP